MPARSRPSDGPVRTPGRRRLVVAVLVSAAVVLSAPVIGDLLASLRRAAGANFGLVINALVVGAVGVAGLFAVARIRERRLLRYAAMVVAVLLGVAYVRANALPSVERFHFVEYGLVTFLFYRASGSGQSSGTRDGRRPGPASGTQDPTVSDASLVVVPILAALVVGTADEWVQWLVPRRYGEVRDIFLNSAAIGCGLLFSLGAEPPARVRARPASGSIARMSAAAAIAVLALGGFLYAVHLGYVIDDAEIGRFRSRHTASELAVLSAERMARWDGGPVPSPRTLSREDQYLTEGLWHVQQRNESWAAGAIDAAWNENRILERHFAPVLRAGHAWPDAQRADAARRRTGASARGFVSRAERYPILTWSKPTFVTLVGLAAAALLATSFTNRR